MVINPHDYRRGLEKLGVIQNDQQAIDLRDPRYAHFAWRVLVALLDQCVPTHEGRRMFFEAFFGECDVAPSDALYAAVEALGRSER